jgi:hypothetical protein
MAADRLSLFEVAIGAMLRELRRKKGTKDEGALVSIGLDVAHVEQDRWWRTQVAITAAKPQPSEDEIATDRMSNRSEIWRSGIDLGTAHKLSLARSNVLAMMRLRLDRRAVREFLWTRFGEEGIASRGLPPQYTKGWS